LKPYKLESYDAADADIEAAFNWYQAEQSGLGVEFLEEVRSAYNRIISSPLKYQELRFGIRRALIRRFPYAIYFVVAQKTVLIVAVLHTARDPAEWQWRL
jgi:plasmid stabilization system protein ParE